jgi:CubicO group peptidase (beta-lactamase class C family)
MVGRRAFFGAASLGLFGVWSGDAFGQTQKQKDEPKTKKRTVLKPVTPAIPLPLKADEQINRLLAPVRDRNRLPGLIGAIVKGDKLASIGVAGIRRVGSDAPIQVGDRFHIGSCTKAMTATLVGMLVDQGLLNWSSTIRDIFPEHARSIHADFATVTLSHLLTHRAGLPHDAPWWGLRGRTPTEQRRGLFSRMLKDPPLTKPGTTYAYSNVDYALAGLMAEQVTGKPWETLMRERLFSPLGMTTAGFGPPGAEGRTNEPWGHREIDGQLRPMLEDNAPSLGPAGTVHLSLPDWAKFAALHLRGAQGTAKLLKPETFRILHTPPPGEEYAGGWFVVDRSWAGGRALMHNGSNTTWYASIWIAPLRDFATLVATNQGSKAAETACDEATEALIKLLAFSPVSPARRKRAGRS